MSLLAMYEDRSFSNCVVLATRVLIDGCRFGYCVAVTPPSRYKVWPVTKFDAGDAKNNKQATAVAGRIAEQVRRMVMLRRASAPHATLTIALRARARDDFAAAKSR